jgi:hypothetical protein
VQAITGEVHGLRRLRSVEPTENVFDVLDQVRPYPTAVLLLVKPFEAAMLKAPDHSGYL